MEVKIIESNHMIAKNAAQVITWMHTSHQQQIRHV